MLVRNHETGLLHKTTDPSWPRCSCGRCVYEDMEFPIYYGTGPDDPHVLEYVAEGRSKGRNSDITDEENIESTITLGIGTYECFECGDVFRWQQREWVHWEEPDIEFELTHWYRPHGASEREDGWREIHFRTRQVGTETPYFAEFSTWMDVSPKHVADHVRTDWAVPFAEAIPVKRGTTLWMDPKGGIWISETGQPEIAQQIIADQHEEDV